MNTLSPESIFCAQGGIAIRLEDGPRRVHAGTDLAALVLALGHAEAAVSTAVNGRFVARAQRAGVTLADGDEVLLFQPIVGG